MKKETSAKEQIKKAIIASYENDKQELDVVELDSSIVEQKVKAINEIGQVLKNQLVAKVDYGVIPGTSKPTLLQPGAEKILIIFGLHAKTELVDKIVDYDRQFCLYTIKVIVVNNAGIVIGEGLGSSNNREKGKAGQDFYTLLNTCLKIAEKRAKVSAVKGIAALSNVFTQDIEDGGLNINGSDNKDSNDLQIGGASKNDIMKFYGTCYKNYYGASRKFSDEEKSVAKNLMYKAIDLYNERRGKNISTNLFNENLTRPILNDIFGIFVGLVNERNEGNERGDDYTFANRHNKPNPPSAQEIAMEQEVERLKKRVAEEKAEELDKENNGVDLDLNDY